MMVAHRLTSISVKLVGLSASTLTISLNLVVSVLTTPWTLNLKMPRMTYAIKLVEHKNLPRLLKFFSAELSLLKNRTLDYIIHNTMDMIL